jgi:predicted histone-like DNA-binding protein
MKGEINGYSISSHGTYYSIRSNIPKKHYVVTQSRGEVSLHQLAEQIAEISTVGSIDTLAVLESLLQVLPKHLLDSKIIRLGDFGSFRISISSSGADTASNFTKRMIKNVKLLYRPGKLIADVLKKVEFVK